MKRDFLSGFFEAYRFFLDLACAPFLVIRAFILPDSRPQPPSPVYHVERRRRAA